jgi:hypothetical protein
MAEARQAMSGLVTSLPEALEALARSLGVVEWWNESLPMRDGYVVACVFACDVCRKRWTHRVDSGHVNDVVKDLFAEHDRHRCEIDLGPAGRHV